MRQQISMNVASFSIVLVIFGLRIAFLTFKLLYIKSVKTATTHYQYHYSIKKRILSVKKRLSERFGHLRFERKEDEMGEGYGGKEIPEWWWREEWGCLKHKYREWSVRTRRLLLFFLTTINFAIYTIQRPNTFFLQNLHLK